MILGMNTDVRHAGKTFHIQTEDSGPANPVLVTHLFIGGTIIATKQQTYADLVQPDGRIDETPVRERMRDQHRGMYTELMAGTHDEAAKAPSTSRSRFKDIPLARNKRRDAPRAADAEPSTEASDPGTALPVAGPPPLARPRPLAPPPTVTAPVPDPLDPDGALFGGEAGSHSTETPLAVPPPLGLTVDVPTVPVARASSGPQGLGPPPGMHAPGVGPGAVPPGPPPPSHPGRAAPRPSHALGLPPPSVVTDEPSGEGRFRPPPLPVGVVDEGSVLDLSDEVDEVSVLDDGGLGAASPTGPVHHITPMGMGRALDPLLVSFLLDERD